MTDTLMKRMFVYSWTWFYIDLLLFFIQINMSSSCLKLLLALTLFFIITECRPQGTGRKPRRGQVRKPCNYDYDCIRGFSCVQKGEKICTKAKAVKPSKYKNTD